MPRAETGEATLPVGYRVTAHSLTTRSRYAAGQTSKPAEGLHWPPASRRTASSSILRTDRAADRKPSSLTSRLPKRSEVAIGGQGDAVSPTTRSVSGRTRSRRSCCGARRVVTETEITAYSGTAGSRSTCIRPVPRPGHSVVRARQRRPAPHLILESQGDRRARSAAHPRSWAPSTSDSSLDVSPVWRTILEADDRGAADSIGSPSFLGGRRSRPTDVPGPCLAPRSRRSFVRSRHGFGRILRVSHLPATRDATCSGAPPRTSLSRDRIIPIACPTSSEIDVSSVQSTACWRLALDRDRRRSCWAEMARIRSWRSNRATPSRATQRAAEETRGSRLS